MRRVRSVWFYLLAASLIASSMLLWGCNSGEEFNADELFSLEDMAQDEDYANSLLDMMNRWRGSINGIVVHLGANPDAVPFDEMLPEGWSRYDITRTFRDSIISDDPNSLVIPGVDNSLTAMFNSYFATLPASEVVDSTALDSTVTSEMLPDSTEIYKKIYSKSYTIWYAQLYSRSFQDANQEFLRFDWELPPANDIRPRKVDYMNFDVVSIIDPDAPNLTTGDSLSLQYADNLQNFSELEGNGYYADVRIVFYTIGNTNFPSGAGMVNVWYGTLSRISPQPGNPQGDYTISGTTTIDNLQNQAYLSVSATVSLRANATGEATIKVDGEERVRLTFESFDTSFHGYARLKKQNFAQKLRF